MDPPAYVPPAVTPVVQDSSRRSIQDLRAQIIANGSVIKPTQSGERPSDDHIEVIVAKTPAYTRAQPASSSAAGNTHWSEKQLLEMNGKRSGSRKSLTIPNPDVSNIVAATSSSSPSPAKHYAVLVRRSGTSSSIRIILKGEPKDTVEEALEWMLERTEMMMHDAVVKYGKPAEESCSVM